MKSNSNILKGLLLIAVAVAAGVGYSVFQKSGGFLTSTEPNAEAYIAQTFPPILFFDSKASPGENGCYDLKWSSLNVTSCVSSWRPTVAVSGGERVCQGKKDTEGTRNINTNIGEISYTITCSGSAGSVSRAIKIKK
ncbi:MAG: hypothetical protein HYV54_00775 [Parcubacteria group bacterium]|nr:hypothetical protein [Parcubacteria group bacterium]